MPIQYSELNKYLQSIFYLYVKYREKTKIDTQKCNSK